ncbi:MAG: hypothetical protein R3F54_12680 [Alphaproteobacteria bacterium]
MPDRLSTWERFKYWLEDRKIARELKQLRQSGDLKRILAQSHYTCLRPGSLQGDDWYHVRPRDSASLGDIVFSSLDENRALWWIVQHQREKA